MASAVAWKRLFPEETRGGNTKAKPRNQGFESFAKDNFKIGKDYAGRALAIADFLRGRIYNRRKKSHGGQLPKGIDQNDPSLSTAEQVAAETGVSPATFAPRARGTNGRRNLTNDQRSILRGRRYNRTKKAHGGTGANQYNSRVEEVAVLQNTAETIAKQHGVSERTIRSDGKIDSVTTL